jgi:hypothetical protein
MDRVKERGSVQDGSMGLRRPAEGGIRQPGVDSTRIVRWAAAWSIRYAQGLQTKPQCILPGASISLLRYDAYG